MAHNDGLYKWNRITKPRVYSRSQRVKSSGDIEDWIKKVEDASSKAAAETFGTKYVAPRREAKEKVKTTIQNAQIHEAAYAEAHDLLNAWVSEKLYLGDELEEEEGGKEGSMTSTQADVSRQWDALVSSDADLELQSLQHSARKTRVEADPYSILYKDDEELVNEVLDNMWEKDIYGDDFKQNLKLEPEKLYDPTTKMKLRHQQVKENREKRIKQKEKKLKELQMKKDSQLKARQMVMKEEHARSAERRREEEEIQRNMATIRRGLEEDRAKQAQQAAREKQEKESLAKQAQAELERQRVCGDAAKTKTRHQTETRRQQILNRMREIETRQAKQRLQTLQKCFSAWYSTVMERRLSLGKAKATADWKLLLRTFNGWKTYTRTKHADKQALNHQQNLKQLHRKTNMADHYYRTRLLSKCFVAWQLFVSQKLSHRLIEEDNKVTKNKMAAFLEAAASGKLWTERKADSPQQSQPDQRPNQLDALFKQSSKPASGTFSLNSTARSDMAASKHTKKVDTPHEPWQITRKHLQLTKKQMANMGHGSGDSKSCTCHQNRTSPQSDNHPNSPHHVCSNCESQNQTLEAKDTQSKKAWAKPAFSVNNFEHRHAAQQKILEMQQKQIREQQKLIEELQSLQKQQMLQQQLLQQEHARRGAGGQTAESIQGTLTGLQQHIQRLQQQLVSGAYPVEHCSPADVAAGSPSSGGNVQNSGRPLVQDIEVRDLEADGDESVISTAAPHTGHSDALKIDLTTVDNADPPSSSNNNKPPLTGKHGKGAGTSAKTTALSSTVVSKVNSTSRVASSPLTSRSVADHPQHTEFLKKMEDRASERARLKQEREEKRRKEEEQRMEQLLAKEEEVRRGEEEEKRKRLEAHRQRKKLEKQREAEKQEFAERMKMLTVAADAHCEKAQLKYRGWLPWRKLIHRLRDREQLADQHHQNTLQRKCLLSWHGVVSEEVRQKTSMADQFHMYLLTKQAFTHWAQIKEASAIQEEKAVRHYESKLKVRVMKIWADYAAEEKVSMWHKERIAREHNIPRIKKKYFRMLAQFPVLKREEELREQRRKEMRRKVANLLPDFSTSQTD